MFFTCFAEVRVSERWRLRQREQAENSRDNPATRSDDASGSHAHAPETQRKDECETPSADDNVDDVMLLFLYQ